MIILSPPDAAVTGERLAALPRLPLDPGGAVFAEPRQAQAFVLAVKLSEQGPFHLDRMAGGDSCSRESGRRGR
jgi:hypothetical protein